MEALIINLYTNLRKIDEDFLDYKKRKDLMPLRQCFSQIQEFAVWIMQENPLQKDSLNYKEQNARLLGILNDLVTAIEQEDYVLAHDTVRYGLMEYLEYFISFSQEEYISDTV